MRKGNSPGQPPCSRDVMRRHVRNRRRIEGVLDGELAATARIMIAAHLRVCPGCREHAVTVREIKRVLAKSGRPSAGSAS